MTSQKRTNKYTGPSSSILISESEVVGFAECVMHAYDYIFMNNDINNYF